VTTLDHLRRHIFPVAFSLLPGKMDTPAARAQTLTIALQESECKSRRQIGGGPARGLYQFEHGTPETRGGVTGVLMHAASRPHLERALITLQYPSTADALYAAVEHNDVLATICARLLLWTDARPLPGPREPSEGWGLYMRTWRPGRPHRETWDQYFLQAWALVAEAEAA
jgi:hypothetical protein